MKAYNGYLADMLRSADKIMKNEVVGKKVYASYYLVEVQEGISILQLPLPMR